MKAVLPIQFLPIYKKRVWGGRQLEHVYERSLTEPESKYGEAWEMVDRADDQSVVTDGKYKGVSLHTLWVQHREEVFGTQVPDSERFPILLKILDCQQDLSVQVHPTEESAQKYGGEPKAEMWYVAKCEPGAQLYVGLKKGVDQESFKKAIEQGDVHEKIHSIEPETGDSIFLDSGRLHAIGAGFIIFEVQQNSDTTYRAFDWNRKGLDGKPRELHIAESLDSIDFSDSTPAMDKPQGAELVDHKDFSVFQYLKESGDKLAASNPLVFSIITIIEGEVADSTGRKYSDGDTFLIPCKGAPLEVKKTTKYLEITVGNPSE